jgi:D-threo-aldose 1-dehydrogenase
MPDTYGHTVLETRACDTVLAILDSPLYLLDTSNNYGFGRDEARIGAAFRDFGGLRNAVIPSTRLDGNCRRRVCPASQS